MPHDAALVIATNEGRPRWSTTEYLIADLWTVWTQKPHYARPKTVAQQKVTAARQRAERTVNKRFAERTRRLMAKKGGDA